MGPDSKSDSNKSCPSTDDETTPKTLVGDDILCYNSNNNEWTSKPKYILDELDKERCKDPSILEEDWPMESPPEVDMLEDRLERQCNNVTSQKKERQGEWAKNTHKVFKKGVSDEVCDNTKWKDGNIVDNADKDFPKQNNREGTDKNSVSYMITVIPEQPASTLISDNRWSDTEEKKDIEKSLSRKAIRETNCGPGVSKLATDIIPLRATQVLCVDDGALLFNQADSNKYEDSKSIRNQLQKWKERMFEVPEKHDSGSEKTQRTSEMDETDGDNEQLRSDRVERSLNDSQTSHDAEYDATTGRCTGTADDDGGTGDETGGDETQGNQTTGRKEEKDAAIQTDLLEIEQLTVEENKNCSNKGNPKIQDGSRKRNDYIKDELENKRMKKIIKRLMKVMACLPIDTNGKSCEELVIELLELNGKPAKTSPRKEEVTTASEVSRRNAKNKAHDLKDPGNGIMAIEALRDEPEKAQVELMEENSKKLVQNSVTQQNDAKKNLKKSTKTACQKDFKKSGNKPNSNTYEKAAKKASNNSRQRGQTKEVEEAQDSTIQENGRIQKKKSGRKKKRGKESDDAKAKRILCEKPERKKRTNGNKRMRFLGEKTEQTSKGRQTAKINKKGGTGNGGTPATQSTHSGSTSQQGASQGQYSSLPVGNGGASANGCGDGDEDDDEDGDRRPRRGQGSRREPADKTISDGETKTDPKSSPTGAVPKNLKGRVPVVPSTAAGAATGCTIASSRTPYSSLPVNPSLVAHNEHKSSLFMFHLKQSFHWNRPWLQCSCSSCVVIKGRLLHVVECTLRVINCTHCNPVSQAFQASVEMCTISVPYRSECQIPFCEELRPVLPYSTENNDVWWNSLSRLIHDYISKILRMGAHSNDPQVQFRAVAKNSQNSLESSSQSMPFYGNSQLPCVPSRNAPRCEVAVCPPPGVNTYSRLGTDENQKFSSMVEVPARMPISPPFRGVRFNSESSLRFRSDGQGFPPRFPPRRDPLAKQSGMSSLFQEGCNSSALMRHLTDKDDYSVDGDETLTNQDQTLTNQGETLTNQPNEALLVPRGGTSSNGQAEAAERHPTLDQPKAHEDILHAFINDNAGNTGMVLPSLSDIAEEIPPAAEVPAVGAEARDSRLIGVVTQVPVLCITDVLALSKHLCHLSEMLMNGAGAQDFQGEEGLLVDEKFCPMDGHYTHNKHWSMHGTIGRGKFGSCKLASDLTTEFIFAVKEVELRTFIHNSQEVTIWCMLNHPNIPKLYGILRIGTKIYYFMEYIRGCNIREILDNHLLKIPEAVALAWVQQVIDALRHMHSQRIVHGDVKASNVVITEDGETAYLVDYGFSRLLPPGQNDFPVEKSPQGTPAYMPPEIAGSEVHGRPADIWSIMCLLLHMLNGHAPWTRQCETVLQTYYVIVTEPPPVGEIPDTCSSALRAFITSGLEKNPENRPTALQCFYHSVFVEDDDLARCVSLPLPENTGTQSWSGPSMVTIPEYRSLPSDQNVVDTTLSLQQPTSSNSASKVQESANVPPSSNDVPANPAGLSVVEVPACGSEQAVEYSPSSAVVSYHDNDIDDDEDIYSAGSDYNIPRNLPLRPPDEVEEEHNALEASSDTIIERGATTGDHATASVTAQHEAMSEEHGIGASSRDVQKIEQAHNLNSDTTITKPIVQPVLVPRRRQGAGGQLTPNQNMAEILAASPVEALHEQLKTLSVTKQKPNSEKDVQDDEDRMDKRCSSGSRKQDDENDSKEGLSMASGTSPGGDATPKQPVQLAPTRRLAPNFEVPYKPPRRNSSKKKQPPKRSQSAIGFPGHQPNPPPVHHSLSSPALEEEETRQREYKRTTSMVSTSSGEIQEEFETLQTELVRGYLKDNLEFLKDNPDGMLQLSLSSPLPPNDVSNYSSSATSVSSGNSGMDAHSPEFFDEETRRENTPFGSSSNSSGIGTRVTVSRQDGQDEMRIRLTPQKTTKDIAKGISAKVFSRPNVSAFTLVSESGDPVPLHQEIGENELRMRMVPVGEHDEWTWKVTRDGGIQAREDDEIFFDVGHFN